MKLAGFVKSLKVGEYLKIETSDKNCCFIKIWRNAEGGYHFSFDFWEPYGEFETAGELLDYIAKHFADCLEYDYEIYKTRAELKAEIAALKKENAKLEKALKSACKIIEDGEMCSVCPANKFCNNSDRTCVEDIYDELMKKAAK